MQFSAGTGLITQLWGCGCWDDMHDFQEQLLTARLAAEDDHELITWAMRRVSRGRRPQPGAPDLPEGTDVRDLHAWRLERYIVSRTLRHLTPISGQEDRPNLYRDSRDAGPP